MESGTSKTTLWPALFVLACLLAVAAVAVALPGRPAVVPADAPPGRFSAARAIAHVAAIAREPHPIGSPASDAAQVYIQQQLTALGIDWQVQDAVGVHPGGYAGTVQNVIGRLPGTGGGNKAVLLMAHYDSVPAGPGASDDGSGVATLLETARALPAGPRLKNDVILLFTDGEEAGMLGAYAFVAEHPWARDVGVALNFEARGHTGPVYTFETSRNNGALIREYGRAAPSPVANSLMYEIYRLLPNDTDFTPFKEASLPGFNMAYIGGGTHYHSQLDTVENLDLHSLQHGGSYALALTHHFGNLDLPLPERPDAVYFDVLSAVLVRYPGAWAVPLAVVAVLLYAIVAALGLRRRRVSLGGIGLGALAFLGNALIVAGVTYGLWALLVRLHPQYGRGGDTYNSLLYLAAFAALAVALTSAFYALLRRWRRGPAVESLALGAMLWWLILAVAAAAALRGASYLALWPLVGALLGLGALFLWPRLDGSPWGRALVLVLAALPVLLLVAPLVYAFHVALTVQMIIVPVIVLLLLLGLLVPHLDLAGRALRWAWPAAAGTVALGCLVAGSLTAGFDADHPRPNAVFYALDANQDRAYWIGLSDPDAWMAQYLPAGNLQPTSVDEFLPLVEGDVPVSQAPVLDLPAPVVELLNDTTDADGRALRLRVSSPRGAPTVYVFLRPGAGEIALAGRPVYARSTVLYADPPSAGFEVEVRVPGPVRVTVVDQSEGLPVVEGQAFLPRPPEMMMKPGHIGDSLLVGRSYDF